MQLAQPAVCPDAPDEQRGPKCAEETQSQGDVGGFAWADDGVGYSLVGHGALETLRPIANEVRKDQKRALAGATEGGDGSSAEVLQIRCRQLLPTEAR